MIQFQRLLDVCRATELLPLGRFCMEIVNCGTVGCMIGNYNEMVGRKYDTFGLTHEDWLYFGVTEREYSWLFCSGTGSFLRSEWMFQGGLRSVSRERALARLRRFIYYKLHKHEMCYSEKYGVRQEARHAEGNHNFAQRAVAKAATCAAV